MSKEALLRQNETALLVVMFLRQSSKLRLHLLPKQKQSIHNSHFTDHRSTRISIRLDDNADDKDDYNDNDVENDNIPRQRR
jgi:hypothetical protein